VIAHTLFCLLPLSTGLRLVHLESGLSSLPLLLSRGRGASLASFCFKSPSRRGFVWFDHIRSRRRLQCAVRCVALRCVALRPHFAYPAADAAGRLSLSLWRVVAIWVPWPWDACWHGWCCEGPRVWESQATQMMMM
jgi:hypothetical protein